MVRLTVRATDETVPPIILKLMVERIGAGVSTVVEKYHPPARSDISEAFSNIMVT